MPVLEVNNLKKYFGKAHAVDGVSFSIDKGEIFGFLGPNGAGKTTTIRCILDFLRPTEGNISIFGLDSQKDSTKIKEKIGYLSGDVRLYDYWTGEDHINLFQKIRGKSDKFEILLDKLGLDPQIKFKNLSSGNKQKLGLVLALMYEPELIIMDEPTLGLDPLLQNKVYEILEEFHHKGTTVFLSSHNLSEVDRICSRVGIIKDGKVIATENIMSLKEKRMHLATVHFAQKFNKNDFNFANISIQQEIPQGLILNIKGDINPLIGKLKDYKIKELEISHASLEEIFLEYYGKGNNVGNFLESPKR